MSNIFCVFYQVVICYLQFFTGLIYVIKSELQQLGARTESSKDLDFINSYINVKIS
jgi:hypothetical protein